MDPELARYLNRNYWQQKSVEMKANTSATQPSAPSIAVETKTVSAGSAPNAYPAREEEVNDAVLCVVCT
jgi:growth factor-regulated tyrosine kinase substrate